MAEVSCTLEEFHSIIGPRIKNDVASVTKKIKNQLGMVCEHCNTKVTELDAAHKHGSKRREIIEEIIEEYKIENETYKISDLQIVLDKVKEYHKSKEVYLFLCKECHRKYDKK